MSPDTFLSPLSAASEYLDGDSLLIADDIRHDLLDRVRDLIRRARSLDDRLVIGLVGGTGVGKSTLINALAGHAISVATDLRPTTDHLLLYRHEDNPFSLADNEEVHLHRVEPLARITLADFPDFDSIEPQHRRILADLFDRLDLLLWVVDPVKYADRAFYDWLALAPQAAPSSLFIFNKIDEFEIRYPDRSEQVVREVLLDLKGRLKEFAGMDYPEILPISAWRAFKDPGGREAPGFSALLERIRDLSDKKRRMAVKTSNLSEMTYAFFRELEAAADLDRAWQGLAKLTRTTETGRIDLNRMIRREAESLTTSMHRAWRAGLTAKARQRAPWPLDFYLFLWDRVTGLWRKSPATGEVGLPRPNLTPLIRRLTAWRGENADALGGQPEAGKRLEKRLQLLDPAYDGEKAAEALMDGGATAAERIAKKRWIVRHHLLPLAVVSYPFWPLLANLASGWLSGQPQAAAEPVSIGWRDMLPLLEIILALYGLQTVYYVYKLDRWADRALAALAADWEKKMLASFVDEELSGISRFVSDLTTEIDGLAQLTSDISVASEASGRRVSMPAEPDTPHGPHARQALEMANRVSSLSPWNNS